MATPTKSQIIAKARELWHTQEARNGNPAFDIEPELSELRESGLLSVAQSELMFSDSTRHELAKWENYQRETEKLELHKGDKLKSLVDDVADYGDLLLVANKGIGKTNSLMVLAQRFRKLPNTRVFIFEDFPKFCNEFDRVPYMRIHDSDVVETGRGVVLEDYFLRHERDYSVKRGSQIRQFLKQNKDGVFTMELKDVERSAFFVYSIVNYFYRKAYLRAYKNVKKEEHVVFIVEEAQNTFDSSTISRKLFNRLRKIFSVARNLNLHFVLASQRLQDLNTKIRGRTRLLLGRVSLDDYELKVYRLLRHSKYRKEITEFERGEFLYAETDTAIDFPKFKPTGKPYEWKPKRTATTLYYPMPQRKPSRLDKLKAVLKVLFWIDRGDLDKPTPIKPIAEADPANEIEEEDEFPAWEL